MKVAPTARPSGSCMAGMEVRPEVAGAGRLDLHHVGAQAAQQLGGPGQGLHLFESEDAHAVEWLAPSGRVGVDDVAQLHVRSSSSPNMSMALPRMIL